MIDRSQRRGLHEALRINKMAQTIAEFMNEELDGNQSSILACIARVHYTIFAGTEPPMHPRDVDQALAIHKALVVQWLANDKKE
jgi:hypothetical protein